MIISGTEISIQLMYFYLNLHQKKKVLHSIYVLANNSDIQTHLSLRDPEGSSKGLCIFDTLGGYINLASQRNQTEYSSI